MLYFARIRNLTRTGSKPLHLVRAVAPALAQGVVHNDMLDEYFRQYALIAIFVAVATAVPIGMLIASWALTVLKIRPYAPDPIKKAIYECGFETLSGRQRSVQLQILLLCTDLCRIRR